MKRLFIITRGSLAIRYGVGTYVRQLVDCFVNTDWKVTVVEVFSLAKELVEEMKEGVQYYQIPLKKRTGILV